MASPTYRQTLHVAEADLQVDAEAPLPEPAPRVVLPEPMLDYACNQQGCCCGGWRIPFRTDDLVRLSRRLDPDQKALLTKDVEFKVELRPNGERVVKELYIVDGDGFCRFLEPSGGCGVHARHGLPALPDLCVDFPVATYSAHEGVDFYYDPVCPSVLDQLAASEAPYRLVERTAPYADEAFSLRAAHARGRPIVRIGEVELTPAELDRIRRVVVRSLEDQSRPPWQHLLGIDVAWAQLVRGATSLDAFEIGYDHDPGPYLRFLGDCLGAHGVGVLTTAWDKYRRFVFAIPEARDPAHWTSLGDHLERWPEAYERWLAPNEDALRPLLLRYLAHRHFAPFLNVKGELKFAAGAIVHAFATALRYACGLAGVLQRPVDLDPMKTAIGASEYLYRSLEIPPESLPWYGVTA
jgi:hypothetical protein